MTKKAEDSIASQKKLHTAMPQTVGTWTETIATQEAHNRTLPFHGIA
jgi:hypothetical protein